MCGYCKLTEKQFVNELSIEEWKTALSLIERLGIKTVKLMGGEPTALVGLEEIIRHVNENTNLKFALLSNSMISDERLDSLVEAGLQGYFASVDNLNELTESSDMDKKASAGIMALRKLKRKGVRLLGANVVISPQNLNDLPELISALSNEGIWINLCPVIHTTGSKGEIRWEYRKELSADSHLKESDIPALNDIMIKLLQFKYDGAKIAAPDSYLINMSKYGVNCDWQCGRFSQLRIDADGALMLCNDIRGEVAEKYNIKTMTVEKYEDFKKDWQIERNGLHCPGCYWSCFYLAEDNLANNKLEFYYAEE